eukprot:678671-Pelagomonas_calceolata.AAC.1
MRKVPDWRTWAYTDGRCQIQNGIQEIGAGVYCPYTDRRSVVKPNGAGFTNTICRAELAAIAAAITYSYSHILQTVSPLFIKYIYPPYLN